MVSVRLACICRLLRCWLPGQRCFVRLQTAAAALACVGETARAAMGKRAARVAEVMVLTRYGSIVNLFRIATR
ncbi:MAG TPA: hypothetical protein DD666_15775 [Advenella kashmirensis]|uniref:Uncharacterized protein n=1 Tax=Advenella kashmirensis TaxID=310575 RepID=A0A356LIR7_9BURK|nr:hypothetical protein [Advenella kashmirensis]